MNFASKVENTLKVSRLGYRSETVEHVNKINTKLVQKLCYFPLIFKQGFYKIFFLPLH